MDARRVVVPVLALGLGFSARAYDVNKNLSIGATLAGGVQCQNVSQDADATDGCRGGVPFQLEVSLRPNEANELFVMLGFAAGNGLNPASPFVPAHWAVDLEDDVKDLNGRNRDYLLAAWYRHTFTFADQSTLGASFGILDSTNYLDSNEYAKDEYSQFMNEAFVNAGTYGLPSYDTGAALEWKSGPWSASALAMNVGENDDGNNYNFWGVQAGYQAETGLGTGNYRLILAGASEEFLDPDGAKKERRLGWGLSLDQAFGEVVGGFLRLAWQQDDAAVDYEALYSGGLNFKGSAWGREDDNVGLGYAYLKGGNLDLDRTHVVEAYYRFGLSEHLALTADVQYLRDEYDDGSEVKGWVIGMRAVAAF